MQFPMSERFARFARLYGLCVRNSWDVDTAVFYGEGGMSRSRPLVLALFFMAFGGLTAFAQSNTGRITGTVHDATGAVIPGVEVTVRDPATGLTRNAITNESGNYQVPLLPPAVYSVETALTGFSTEVRSGITVDV